MVFLGNKSKSVQDEQAMHDVMRLMDDWQVPEPSPWFDARMAARFRAEVQRPPESLFARLRDRWLFSRETALKPAMASAMALLLVAGGGTYWQAAHMQQQSMVRPASVSPTVQELQMLDGNAQAIQQMGQLLDDDGDASPQS